MEVHEKNTLVKSYVVVIKSSLQCDKLTIFLLLCSYHFLFIIFLMTYEIVQFGGYNQIRDICRGL